MLVSCVAYQNGKKIADLSIAQISDYVQRPECFVWVGLNDPSVEELEQMRVEFDLHPLAVEDARNGHQSPKIEEYADSLFVVLQTIEVTVDKELNVGEVDIFVAKNYVLSVRKNTKQGFLSVRDRCEREPKLLKHGSGFVLYALMDEVVDRYAPVEEHLDLMLEKIEDKIFTDTTDLRGNIEELYNLKRQLVILQHATSPLVVAVAKLFGGRIPSVCQAMQDYYRDVFDHLSRSSKNIDSLREMTSTALQVNLSMITLGESEVSKKLAAYGALFAVPTAVAGIYGMNFQNMPELKAAWGYPLVMGVIIVADLLLWRRFKKTGWI